MHYLLRQQQMITALHRRGKAKLPRNSDYRQFSVLKIFTLSFTEDFFGDLILLLSFFLPICL